MLDLKSDDWSNKFEAINTLRRVVEFHPEVMQGSKDTPQLVQDILKQVESLRSSIAKNALILITEMCGQLKRYMDSACDQIFLKLMKKSNDTNIFISEEVRKALQSLCCHCSDSKIIPAIVNAQSTKSSTLCKINIILCLEEIVQKNGAGAFQLKDIDKIITMLSKYLSDGSLDVRSYAKRVCQLLNQNSGPRNEFDRLIRGVLNEASLAKMKSVLDKEDLYHTQNAKFSSSTNSKASLTNQNFANSPQRDTNFQSQTNYQNLQSKL